MHILKNKGPIVHHFKIKGPITPFRKQRELSCSGPLFLAWYNPKNLKDRHLGFPTNAKLSQTSCHIILCWPQPTPSNPYNYIFFSGQADFQMMTPNTYQMDIKIFNYSSILLKQHWLEMSFRSMQHLSNQWYSISSSTSFLQCKGHVGITTVHMAAYQIFIN